MGGPGAAGLVTVFLAWSGALGGACVFIAGVFAIVRGIFRLADATGDNTVAIQRLTGAVGKLTDQANSNTQRIARLEGRRR